MIAKAVTHKCVSLRGNLLHRLRGCGFDEDEAKKEASRLIRGVTKLFPGGYRHCKRNIYVGELVLSEKVSDEREFEKVWARLERIAQEKMEELRSRCGVKVFYFRHKEKTVDGFWNVHIHCLFIPYDRERKQAITVSKRKVFQMAMDVYQRYAPEVYARIQETLMQKKTLGRGRIGKKQPPLWLVQRFKAELLERLRQREEERERDVFPFVSGKDVFKKAFDTVMKKGSIEDFLRRVERESVFKSSKKKDFGMEL